MLSQEVLNEAKAKYWANIEQMADKYEAGIPNAIACGEHKYGLPASCYGYSQDLYNELEKRGYNVVYDGASTYIWLGPDRKLSDNPFLLLIGIPTLFYIIIIIASFVLDK